jgi:hypothetical protein
MSTLENLTDFDIFFYYGQNDISLENESDLMTGLMQPKRTLFYNRKDGCGVADKENYPNTVSLFVNIIYDIINWIEYRNTQVQDGSDNLFPDRRIFASQNTINFKNDKKGNLDIIVLYIETTNFSKLQQISMPI